MPWATDSQILEGADSKMLEGADSKMLESPGSQMLEGADRQMLEGAGRRMLDTIDRAIVAATQGGLPLVPRPYHAVGEAIGASGEEVIARMQRMLSDGIIRRIAVVPDHYRIGYAANGMSVWDVTDARVDALGEAVGKLDFVSHCYHRPRHLPDWRYNLFAMVHGHDGDEVEAKVLRIRDLLGDDCHADDILYSTRILKKTGLRIATA
jgi:DNA-binding Lrp family transcriptional regulator